MPEVFYGGARGGGKTDGVLGKYAIKGERYGKRFNAIFFRRELPMADDAIERSDAILGPLGWKYNAAKYSWRSPAGGRLRFRPLERVTDADKYQGQNVTDACVEEAGQYENARPIDRLNGVLRSAHGVPTQLLLTGNPGGPGQGWLRERYVDPWPLGMRILTRRLPNGRDHKFVFIPSKLNNNRVLLANDPDYVNRLYMVGSAELVRAWLDGDWNAVEGAFFDCWSRDKHIIPPADLPAHWLRFVAFDWGSAEPFCALWFAVASERWAHPSGRTIPAGALVVYREWYGAKEANVGLKMRNEDIGRGMLERETAAETIAYRRCDPSIFSQHGGPSIAEQMAVDSNGAPITVGGRRLLLTRADNTRIGQKGTAAGWAQVRARLIGVGNEPMLYVTAGCRNLIRTLPVLQHHPDKPEDIMDGTEDHAPDTLRYGCNSRPWVTAAPEPSKTITTRMPTFNELVRERERGRDDD